MKHVEILEVGPRDGLQNEDRVLDVDTRVELINRLVSAGVRRMEAVSFVRPDLVPQMAGAEEVMAQVPHSADVSYVGLVLNRRGAERAVETQVQELNMVVPVTDTFAMRNQGRTVEQLLVEAAETVQIAKEAGRFASVTLAVSFGCPFEGVVSLERVEEVVRAILDMGCDEIAFADTIGVGGSRRVREFAQMAKSLFGPELLRFHFHNTRNTGYSNAVTAVSEAAALNMPLVIDASVGGFGGCPFAPAATGNIATEDVLYGFSVDGVSMKGNLDAVALVEHARWLSLQLDKQVQSLIPKAGWFPA
ncbi:hydroxymethylglutaryl-CoA lyase [Candidatus Aquiluna sp. UB-MaderosW2red]|uniref:hydroxymethylglutaryl-CoA lyase n=1 Tax=Candidatus Aquiluna sp. UB-MaderosW2red TaxID=1855377 RepID=UPI000875B383|nr:hydroxymethylglutaryl-CoA lyase [Candidatus Aquiluna sp. UB-MaderosW2red]SCX05319.1 hydroxymethylglutaryl-CoA lyase [Candidatus Aquiluna sp. UB-MaderosW2red]